MKILLVNPNSNFLISEKVFPSLGLLYLSAYLKKHGYADVSLIDMNDENPLPEEITADVVGFYSNTPQFPLVVKVAKELRARNLIKDAVYVFGGPHVSGKPEDGLAEADVVVVGEGERAFLDIIRKREDRSPQDRLMKYDYIKNIDEIPFPDRGLIDVKSYKYFIDGRLTTTVISSRGCPFGCNFCANNAWGKSLRMRSPENLIEELKLLKRDYGYESFMFFDDTMTVDKKRMDRICDLIKELDVIYRCFIRSDTVDQNIIAKMRDSGCVEVGIGVESGSQRILNNVNKGETVKMNMRAIKLCHAAGIRTKGFLIVGLPGEDRNSIKETVSFLEEANLNDLDISIYTPYPGSYIYKNRDKFDITFRDDYEHAWYKGKPGSYVTNVSTRGLGSDEIMKLRESMEKQFKKQQTVKST